MGEISPFSDRRKFIANSLQMGVAALLAGDAVESVAVAAPQVSSASQVSSARAPSTRSGGLVNFPTVPARVFIEHENGLMLAADRAGARFTSNKAVVQFERSFMLGVS
jgi:hypothetical protein